MRTTYRASKVLTLRLFANRVFSVANVAGLIAGFALVTTGANTIPQVASVVEVENGVLLERGIQA